MEDNNRLNENYDSGSESNKKNKPSKGTSEESKEKPANEVDPAEPVTSNIEMTEEQENGTKEEATTAEAVNDTDAEENGNPG